jgi:hypothetical protein
MWPVLLFRLVGDYDPAGVLIDIALERELREHLDPDIDLQFKRIGITPEQIEAFDLPAKPRKSGDRRSLHIQETVEAEAMPVSVLRGILVREIEALLPPHALKVAKVEEQSAREYFKTLADIWDKADQ